MWSVFFWLGRSCPSWVCPSMLDNKEYYYFNVLHQLRVAKRWKWPQLWATGDWQLHHDNVFAHASPRRQNFLAKHQITQVTQSPCHPDLVPCNSGFSQNENHFWKGRDFRPSVRFRETWQASWWWLGEVRKVPRCFLGRRLWHPMYNASCILYLLQ